MLGHVRNLGNVREDIPLGEFAVYLERKSQGQSKGASCGVLGDFRGEGPMLHLREEQRNQRRKQSQRGRTGSSMGYPHPITLQGEKQPGNRLSGQLQGSMLFRGEPQPGIWETWVLVPFL